MRRPCARPTAPPILPKVLCLRGRNRYPGTGGKKVSSAKEWDVIVVGGGPGGTTAATIAAQGGLRVLLLEAAEHPRRHVGESTLPGIIPILEELGALGKVNAAGFGRKTGATHWNWGATPRWDLSFRETDAYDEAYFVDRARFDALLLEHAADSGVDVRQRCRVLGPLMEEERVVGVSWKSPNGREEARARWVIDASGQARIVAQGFSERRHIPGLRHACQWAHWSCPAGRPPRLEHPREAQALFVAEEGHWLWHFPLEDQKSSVGIVSLEGQPLPDYVNTIRTSPLAELLQHCSPGPIARERDWSYRIEPVAGNGWFACGDAAGFIDPILSTGVFLAMHSGWHIGHLLRTLHAGQGDEAQSQARYQEQFKELFDDLLSIVRFFYQQGQSRDDYFWRSKEILRESGVPLKPQKAFLILTSGLVKNLAFEERRSAHLAKRQARALRGGEEPRLLDDLGFVCFHLQDRAGANLYVLLEPRSDAAPALFRNSTVDLNVLAPKYDNNPIAQTHLEAPLRTLGSLLDDLGPCASFGEFWRTNRAAFEERIATLDTSLELLRVFGE